MKKLVLSIFVVACAAIFFSSCTKEQLATTVATIYDNRDSVEGTFNGTLVTTISGNAQSASKAVTISKGSNGKLIISIASDLNINTDIALGTKSNLTGSILQQDVTYNGNSATLVGKGVVGQHFIYTSTNNSFTFGATITQGSSTADIAFIGTK
jgi:outer membrane lipoprotein-sorting protein